MGAQAGVAAGSVAMILMNDKAVNSFKKNDGNNFSLDANAGLTVVNYSADAQASAGKGDVVLWSDTAGAFAGASVGISDIARDDDENRGYYNRQVNTTQIITGAVSNPHAESLRDTLPSRMAAR